MNYGAHTPEGRVKRAIRQALDRLGVMYFMPVPYSAYGASTVDFIGCHRGRFVAIEAKAPGKRPTARQEGFLARVRAAGGIALVIDSAEMAHAMINEALEEHDVVPRSGARRRRRVRQREEG